MMAYLDHIIESDRAAAARAYLISRLVYAEGEGHRLSREELCSNLLLLLVARRDVNRLLSNGVLALCATPTSGTCCSAVQIGGHAVDELLRTTARCRSRNRIATTDVDLRGKHIRAGHWSILRGLGDRDPRKFAHPTPSTSPATRADMWPSATECTTASVAHLAKAEGAAALSALLRRTPASLADDARPCGELTTFSFVACEHCR